jgi:LAO/AO transport system kinase
VFLTVAPEGTGVPDLMEAIERHAGFLAASGGLVQRRRARLERLTREVVERALRQLVWNQGGTDDKLAAGLDLVLRGERSPYQLAEEIVAGIARGNHHGR